MIEKRILIIDDAMFMRNLIKDILTKAGFEVCGEAGNAVEGVEKYKELKPDLVTLDIVMPRMEEIDGITAVKQIIAIDPTAKIIVVSVLAERKLVEEALSYGAKDFIVKPFTAEKLLMVIRRVLGEGAAQSGGDSNKV
jgi:two-component system chemotaxis response regulator CheY